MLALDSNFLLMQTLGGGRWWCERLGSCHLCGRPGLSSWLPDSAWPSPSHCWHLGMNQQMGALCCLSLCPSFCLFNKINILSVILILFFYCEWCLANFCISLIFKWTHTKYLKHDASDYYTCPLHTSHRVYFSIFQLFLGITKKASHQTLCLIGSSHCPPWLHLAPTFLLCLKNLIKK